MKENYLNKTDIDCYLFMGLISIQYGLIDTQLEITGWLSTVLVSLNILLFLKWLLQNKVNFKILIIIFTFLVIAALTYLFTKETLFMIMLMSAIIISKSSYEDIFRFIFKVRLLMLLFILFLSLSGILSIFETDIYKGGAGITVVGYGLGYTHPNRLAYTVGFLVLLYICYKNSKIKKKHLAVIFSISWITYLVTKTRTLIAVTLIVIFLLFIVMYAKEKNMAKRIFNRMAEYVMPICAVLSLGMPILQLYSNGKVKTFLQFINGHLGSRFTHIYRVLLNYKIPIWGGRIKFELLDDLYGYSTVDNGYLRLLYEFGSFGFLVFLLFYLYSVRKLIKNKQYVFVVVIIAVSLWAILENILRSFAINFTVVFWSELLRRANNKKELNNMGIKNPIKMI